MTLCAVHRPQPGAILEKLALRLFVIGCEGASGAEREQREYGECGKSARQAPPPRAVAGETLGHGPRCLRCARWPKVLLRNGFLPNLVLCKVPLPRALLFIDRLPAHRPHRRSRPRIGSE